MTLDPITASKRAIEWNHVAGYFHPRSDVLPSAWAERDKTVAEGDYAKSPWRWTLTPYLREIVDFAARPWEYGANKGVVLKSAQVGYTQGVLGTLIGWTIVESPAPMLLLLPDNTEAQRFSRTKLTDILTTTPAVRDRLTVVPELSRGRGLRQASSTMLYQDFPGGFLLLGGALSDVTTRSQVVKRAWVDEADEMKVRGEGQGDVLDRLKRRIDQFPREGVMLIGSSPSNEGTSVVWREWLQSDQRKWFCPCPHCGEFQEWEFGAKTDHGLKWPSHWVCCGETVRKTCETCGSQPGDAKRYPVHDTSDPYYVCLHCAGKITRSMKPAMVQAGEWRVTRPEGRYPGWKLSVLFSLLGAKAEWSYVAEEWVEADRALRTGNREKLKVFTNTMLGEVWTGREDVGGGTDSYEGRAVRYPDNPKGGPLEIPDGVGHLVASVDIHKRYAEVLVRGYGLDDESWDILHHRIEDVSPLDDDMWRRVYHFLSRSYQSAAGAKLQIGTTLVDSGNWAVEVYKFCAPLGKQNIFAYKGDFRGARPLRRGARDGERKRHGAVLWHVDTDAFKTTLSGRLAVPRPGPGYMHLRSQERRLCNGFDAEYFAQLRSEKRTLTRDKWGRPKYQWEVLRENHAWDLHVMCLAAWGILCSNYPELHDREVMEQDVGHVRHGPTREEAGA